MQYEVTEEMIQAEFKINAELEALSPKMSKEEYADFVADLKSNGQREDIEVMPDKTIVNGHHRYHALHDIGLADYKITFKVLNFTSIQEAKEYAFQIDDKQKHSNMYQRVTHALAVYGKDCYGKDISDKEVANKITGKISRETVTKIRELNDLLLVLSTQNPEIGSCLKKQCIEDNKWHETLDILKSAITVEDAIKQIQTRVDWSQSVTKEKRVKLQEKIKAKYEPLKYMDKTASKKLLKEVSLAIEELSQPKIVNNEKESYVEDISKVSERFNLLAAKYPERIFSTTIDTTKIESNYSNSAEDNIKEFFTNNLLPTKKSYVIIAIELLEELIPQ